jgi:hypothetical protein
MHEKRMQREEREPSCRKNRKSFLREERNTENLRDSLVVSWLGTGVDKMHILSASEPMVGWKGAHPQ